MKQENVAFKGSQARWIWANEQAEEDCYYEFKGSFVAVEGRVSLRVSAETSYALYLNGVLVPSTQFPSFEAHPVYQCEHLRCHKGLNGFRFIVYHCGVKGFSTMDGGPAGLLYSFMENGRELAYSSRKTRSRLSPLYLSGQLQMVSPQLGYSYAYDATQETNALGFRDSVEVTKSLALEPRDNKEPVFLGRAQSVVSVLSPTLYQIDLQQEEVGYLELDFDSPSLQNIEIFYAEHLVEDRVVWMIDGRHFKLDYKAKAGPNVYLGPFLRLGARYLEIQTLEPITIHYLGIQRVAYPFVHRKMPPLPPLRKKIFEVARHTLECCYFNHAENTPWREQALYVGDIRNELLASYYAFHNPEAARSSLALFAKDEREDGLLRICAPSSLNLVIPAGSCHYIKAIKEYGEHTGDLSLAAQVEGKLNSLMRGLLRMEKDGLLYNYQAKTYWNFYDWRKGLDGTWPTACDFCLNAFVLSAMADLESIEKKLGHPFLFSSERARLSQACHAAFYVPEKGLFSDDLAHSSFSGLGNSLAILSAIASPAESRQIAKTLMLPNTAITTLSLGMRSYLYDALLAVSKKNAAFVLAAIDADYKAMLQQGATSFYETEVGYIDFMGAGSLCHGWSTLPIYYYSLLQGD